MRRRLAIGMWVAALAGALGVLAVAPASADSHDTATTTTATTVPPTTTTAAPTTTTTTTPASTTTVVASTTTTVPSASTTAPAGAVVTPTTTSTGSATTTTTTTAGASTTTTRPDAGPARRTVRARPSGDLGSLPPDPESSISPPDLGQLFTDEAPDEDGSAPKEGSTRGLLTGGLGTSVAAGLLLGLRDRSRAGSNA